MIPYDAAIIGYGPVGAALGILLAQRGCRVLICERWPEPYPLPRAVHYEHETARILQACGLGESLPAISEPATVYEWRNGAGQTLLRFGRIGDSLSGWPESSMFHQPDLERLLDARARALPDLEIRRGVALSDLRQDADGVELVLQPVAMARDAHGGVRATRTDAPQTARARWVVGCDGANSTVRTLVGAAVTDLGFFYDWLIVDVIFNAPRVFDPINLQICDPRRPTTLVSGGPGRRRWEFMRLPHESREALNDAATAWRLLAPWNVTPETARLERHAVYTFQARWADAWRHGRVLLAGDAAHQMPPFAGQGMCSGLRDAMNLAWKLHLVIAGRAPVTLLDTYDRERAANVRTVINFSMELGRVICVPDPAEAAARDAAMIPAVQDGQMTTVPPLPGIDGGVCRGDDPLAGRLFVQGRVRDGARVARFDDVAGAGWRLVTVGPPPSIPPELADWFAGLGGRAVGVGDGTTLADVDGTYERWFAEHGVGAVLQRPDFYIFGASADAGAAPELLHALRASLQ